AGIDYINGGPGIDNCLNGETLVNCDTFCNSSATYSVGRGPADVVTADLKGDDSPDIAVSNFESNTVSLRLKNGDGTFHAARDYPAGAGPAGIAEHDLNHDSIRDLVVANAGRPVAAVSVLLGTGGGKFASPVTYALRQFIFPPAHTVKIDDFDRDGRPDLAVAD